MIKPTPEILRLRDEGIQSISERWYVDFSTHEIRRISPSFIERILSPFWRRRDSVDHLYWWTRRRWDDEDLMPERDPMKHDDVPLPEIARKHQMINGWTIPRSDIVFLKDGPLADESGRILVPHLSPLQKFVTTLNTLKPLSWIWRLFKGGI